MLEFAGSTTVYLACGGTDLRKSYMGLAAIVKLKFHLDPYPRSMFAFCNRRRTSIKILQMDLTAYRLEKAKELAKQGELMYMAADKTGVKDPNYFGKCFKKYTGVSYREYQAKLKGERG